MALCTLSKNDVIGLTSMCCYLLRYTLFYFFALSESCCLVWNLFFVINILHDNKEISAEMKKGNEKMAQHLQRSYSHSGHTNGRRREKNEQNYTSHGLYSRGQVNYIFTRCNYTWAWGVSRSTYSLINARTGRSLEVNKKTFPSAGSLGRPSFPARLPRRPSTARL